VLIKKVAENKCSNRAKCSQVLKETKHKEATARLGQETGRDRDTVESAHMDEIGSSAKLFTHMYVPGSRNSSRAEPHAKPGVHARDRHRIIEKARKVQ